MRSGSQRARAIPSRNPSLDTGHLSRADRSGEIVATDRRSGTLAASAGWHSESLSPSQENATPLNARSDHRQEADAASGAARGFTRADTGSFLLQATKYRQPRAHLRRFRTPLRHDLSGPPREAPLAGDHITTGTCGLRLAACGTDITMPRSQRVAPKRAAPRSSERNATLPDGER